MRKCQLQFVSWFELAHLCVVTALPGKAEWTLCFGPTSSQVLAKFVTSSMLSLAMAWYLPARVRDFCTCPCPAPPTADTDPSIFRWTLMSLTLITVHNQRHHFILNLAGQHIFSAKWKSAVPSASFITIRHTDAMKLTGINIDKQGELCLHVIYWYPLRCELFFFFSFFKSHDITGRRDAGSHWPHNTIWMIETHCAQRRNWRQNKWPWWSHQKNIWFIKGLYMGLIDNPAIDCIVSPYSKLVIKNLVLSQFCSLFFFGRF